MGENRRLRALCAAALTVLLAACPLASQAMDDEYRLPPDVYPVRIGFWPPVQLPIPWFGYTEETPWDVYEIWGIDLALVWSANVNLYGLGVGGYTQTSKDLCGLELDLANRVRHVYGVQAAGLAYSGEMVAGVQFGIASIAMEAYGVQAGAWSWARDRIAGVQFGGFCNGVRMDGVQLAGANWMTQATGVQIGAVNIAERVSGLQFGAVNIAQDLYGVQIGVLNVNVHGDIPCMVIANAQF